MPPKNTQQRNLSDRMDAFAGERDAIQGQQIRKQQIHRRMITDNTAAITALTELVMEAVGRLGELEARMNTIEATFGLEDESVPLGTDDGPSELQQGSLPLDGKAFAGAGDDSGRPLGELHGAHNPSSGDLHATGSDPTS